MHWCNLNSLGSTLRISKIGVLVQHTDFLYITSRYNQGEAYQTLTHIYVYLWALYQIWVSCQSIYIESRTTIFDAWRFSSSAGHENRWHLTCFRKMRKLALGYEAVSQTGLLSVTWYIYSSSNIWRLELLDELFPKHVTASHPMNVSSACDMWHVTLSHRDMWQYLTLTWDMWDILCC